MDLLVYLDIAEQVSKKVGQFLSQEFGETKEMFHKEQSHYGIEDDKNAHNLYVEFLTEKTPDISIFSEEGDQVLDENLMWVIDPIEGTSNYRVGNPFFATQICLFKNLEPIVAVIYAPKLDLLFKAVKGGGSRLNGKVVKVDSLEQLHKAIVSINKGSRQEDKEWFQNAVSKLSVHIRSWRMYGATGLEMAFLSSGLVEVCINSGSNLYDYAPGVLLVREAGGKVINHQGEEWTYQDKTVIAGNSIICNRIRELLVN